MDGLNKHQACLLLGSNIYPEVFLPLALRDIRKRFAVKQISSVWETPAVGSNGPDFLNFAVLISTTLDLQTLKLQVLRPLEVRLGRVRSADKNAARTIDLDLIVWDGHVVDANLWRYAHVAVPVSEILPYLWLPETGESLMQVADRLRHTTSLRPKPEVLSRSLLGNESLIKNKQVPPIKIQ